MLHQTRRIAQASAALGVRHYAQAPALTSATGSGFLGGLFGGSSPSAPPMTVPLQGVPTFEYDTTKPAPTTAIGVLGNGVKIAAQEAAGPKASVALFINSGSAYETPFSSGVSHLLEQLAFKSTANRSHFSVVREIEAIGAQSHAAASREQMAYWLDGLKVNLPQMVELLVDNALNPAFHSWEVSEVLAKMGDDIKEASQNPHHVLIESMHKVAFQGPLGMPLVCPEGQLGLLSGEICSEFVAANYTAPRIVLGASGVSQAELQAVAEPLLGLLPAAPATALPPSVYTGGDWRSVSATPATNLVVAFQANGGWRNIKGAVALSVLQVLMGGGSSFSAGGPGKGMYSRLYSRVLNQYAWAQSCSAVAHMYDDTALFGIAGSTDPYNVDNMVDVICKELQAVASGGITDQELARAKNATIASVYMNLESRVILVEDICRQLLTYGECMSEEVFIKHIQELTKEDLTKLVADMLNTPVTVCSMGDLSKMPTYNQLSSRF
mmetsp:Transcript_4982/g.18066  ORF Transcript_4982/g.18066 Transcript_4982/m.18066 type:complete len:496 (-) Transcript_4982:120-1607(-)